MLNEVSFHADYYPNTHNTSACSASTLFVSSVSCPSLPPFQSLRLCTLYRGMPSHKLDASELRGWDIYNVTWAHITSPPPGLSRNTHTKNFFIFHSNWHVAYMRWDSKFLLDQRWISRRYIGWVHIYAQGTATHQPTMAPFHRQMATWQNFAHHHAPRPKWADVNARETARIHDFINDFSFYFWCEKL